MATQWEYRLEEIGPEADTIAQHLNDASGEGWDLVTGVGVGGNDGSLRQHLVFRREVTNPTWDQ